MRRFWVSLVVVMLIIVPVVGCGSSDGGTAEETNAVQTPTSQAPTTQAPTTETSATETSATTTSTGQTSNADWTTIATMNSTDAPWQGMEGILVSQPFTASGEVQVVLDMPDAGDIDGVIVAFVEADKLTDVTALLDAVQDAVVVVVPAARPVQTAPGLDGTYVLVNSVPTSTAWSLEVQTRP